MSEVVSVLELPVEHQHGNHIYLDCVNPSCLVTAKQKKFDINFSKDKFHCFGCGAGGNPVTLFRLATGLSQTEALNKLRECVDGEDHISVKAKAIQEKAEETPQLSNRVRSFAERDIVYNAYLSLLTLLDKHKENLLARGLTEDEIAKDGYKSVPVLGRTNIVKSLMNMGIDVEGIPGFFVDDDGDWTIYTPFSGYYIPIRLPNGLIQGLQIRRDSSNTELPRYMWFSTPEQYMGAATTAYPHFVGDFKKGSVILIEGALKANVSFHLANHLQLDTDAISFIGLSSVTTQQLVVPAIQWALRNGDIKCLIEAFDRDKTKKQIAQQRRRLWQRMNEACPDRSVKLLTMKPEHFYANGLDDHLKSIYMRRTGGKDEFQ